MARGYPVSLVKRVALEVPFSRRSSLLREDAHQQSNQNAQNQSAQVSPSPDNNNARKIDFISPYTELVSRKTLVRIFKPPDDLLYLPRTRFVFIKNKTIKNHLVRARVHVESQTEVSPQENSSTTPAEINQSNQT